MPRSEALQNFVDEFGKTVFGISNTEATTKNICIICKKDANEFKDRLSRDEYGISGLCQECQDGIFE
jgi:hypothetical protein